MNYPESVRFLYALGNEIKTAKFGLERMRQLCDALGNPERACRLVHVAGTNGKGSTCAMIEAGLRAAGLRTGLYTSPHLVEPTERIQVAGAPVSHEQFAAAFDHVHETAERLLQDGRIDLHPTYFETVTAMAFVLFRELKCEIVVLEVGLGGRLDATNVVMPELCVITPIDYDHEQYLGRTIEAIAGEKAGILKRGTPAIFARQRSEAECVLINRARKLDIQFDRVADHRLERIRVEAHGSEFELDGRAVTCPLAGEHQIENAATAALALSHLQAPVAGLARTVWPGRLERLAEDPEIILDGAHNPAGARALAAYIERFYRRRRIWLIYGSMRDKAVEEIEGALFPLAHCVIATAPRFARALRPEAIRDLWPEGNVLVADTIDRAIAIARDRATPGDAIFITGSLFLVGEARALLLQ
ncbi:MAG TPA: folylpolyglutamate synthase/dihydrofolate synthase family protein [Bryobacteraceae bacterium]|jgi:dihydrofolate synthase/folylpolyglutamate synthase|nr:folylpolyglutamate synthase/dihydrofolate synthase family protein [Bryobacteraceae bacterium]